MTSRTLERLTGAADVRSLFGPDPFVTHLTTRWVPDPPSLRLGGAVAMAHDFWDEPHLVLTGPPEEAAALLVRMDLPDVSEVSIPAAALELLAEGFPLRPDVPWAFRWTAAPPPRPVADGVARWLGPEDDAEVDDLLDRGFPDASVRPGNSQLRRFAGIRDAGGRLVACAGDATGDPTIGFLASITSDPQRRGTGLGITVSAWATQELLREHGRVGLWHMGANAAADAVYTALGYRDEHRMVALTPPCGG